MRELSFEEMELIAGGDITVVGNPGGGGGYDGGYIDPGYGGGGGGGGGDGFPPDGEPAVVVDPNTHTAEVALRVTDATKDKGIPVTYGPEANTFHLKAQTGNGEVDWTFNVSTLVVGQTITANLGNGVSASFHADTGGNFSGTLTVHF